MSAGLGLLVVPWIDLSWLVIDGGGQRTLAFVQMDTYGQIYDVVLHTEIPAERRAVMELCAAHVLRYVKRRSLPPIADLPSFSTDRELTREDSFAMMDFATVPETVRALPDEALGELFRRRDPALIVAAFEDHHAAVQHVLDEATRQTGVSFAFTYRPGVFLHDVRLTVTANSPAFTFWRDAYWSREHPRVNTRLVPGYHPTRKGMRLVATINGCTDGLIAHDIVQRISCPPEATRTPPTDIGRSWYGANHPFRARGSSIEVEIESNRCLSAEGSNAMLEVVLAALGHGNRYVDVSGGFKPPFEHRLNDEVATCVWEYRTLEAEGQLADALIPDFFGRDGWAERSMAYDISTH